MTEEEIAAAIASDPDAAPEWTDEDWANATVHLPPPKKAISIRIDTEVLDWFKSLGPGYQTRINMILRGYMDRHRKRGGEGT